MPIILTQILGLMILLACVIALMQKKEQSALSLRLMLTCIACTVMNCGYFMFVIAGDDSAAKMAVKFEYLGTVLFFYCFILFLISYLHLKPHMLLLIALAVLETATVGIFWNERLRRQYYGDYSFLSNAQFGIFAKNLTPGPLCIVQNVLITVLTVLALIYTLQHLSRVKLRAERISLLRLAFSQGIIAAAMLYQQIFRPEVELLPIAAAVSVLLLVICVLTDHFFGITDSGRAWLFEQMGDAYIIVDRLYGFLDANLPAKRLFPVLNDIKSGEIVPEEISSFFAYQGEGHEMRDINGKYYESMFTAIQQKGSVAGYALILNDVDTLFNYKVRLETEVREKTAHIREVQNSIITGIANVIDSRDANTGEHILRTSQVISIFRAKLEKHEDELHLTDDFLTRLVRAAPMHDLGKIAIDDRILRKTARFTPEEYAEMKRHPEEGAKVLRKVLAKVDDEEFVKIAINVAHYHHERWDGAGYPDGLAGEEIPIEARIMALADVFDALVSKRCYKEAYSFDRAFRIMTEGLDTQFDPKLGALFLECRPQLEMLYEEMA